MTPDEVSYVRSSKINRQSCQGPDRPRTSGPPPRRLDLPVSTDFGSRLRLQSGKLPAFLSSPIAFSSCTDYPNTSFGTACISAGREGMSARQECLTPVTGTIEKGEFVFRREKEIAELRQRFAVRKSFVLYGPSGSGKTFLLQRVMPEFSNVLYCQEATSPQLVFQSLALALVASRDRFVRGWLRNPQAVKTKTAISLRGIVLNAVRRGNYFVVLDHLCGPAAALSADTRDLMLYGGTPVAAVARSAHMEDLGFLTAFFALRTERMRLPNFCVDPCGERGEFHSVVAT